jgi:hypothetical protein
MLNPAPRPKAKTGLNFNQMLDTAMRHAVVERLTPDHALRLGVSMYGIVCYAAGVADVAQRAEAQSDVIRSPWAMNAVTSLVKAARDPESKAARLLASAKAGVLIDLDDPLVEKITEAIAA